MEKLDEDKGLRSEWFCEDRVIEQVILIAVFLKQVHNDACMHVCEKEKEPY